MIEQVQINAAIIRLINLQVTDLIDNIRRTIKDKGIETLEDIRKAPAMLVSFSDDIGDRCRELKNYLFARMYNHHRVNRMKFKAKRVLQSLFNAYCEEPGLLPLHYRDKMKEEGKERIICDYIAGMTDRYAIDEYVKLFDPRVKV